LDCSAFDTEKKTEKLHYPWFKSDQETIGLLLWVESNNRKTEAKQSSWKTFGFLLGGRLLIKTEST
jgi:hypothetical protein